MRIATLALSACFLSVLALAAMPVGSACSMLGAPTGCVTSMYAYYKGAANREAVAVQLWGQTEAYAASLCAPAQFGVQTPGVNLLPAPQYASEVQQATQAFQQGAAQSLFPALGAFGGTMWFSTMALAVGANGQVDYTSSHLTELTKVQPPDLSSVNSIEGVALANVLGAQANAQGSAACAQGLPGPPL